MVSSPSNRQALLAVTFIAECALLLVSNIWSNSSGSGAILSGTFNFNYRIAGIGIACGAAMALTAYGFVLLGNSVRLFAQLKTIVEELLVPLLTDLHPLDLLSISLLSGFCEEVFFRGLLQAKTNILIASALFGIFHDPSFRFVSYSILAFAYGLILGGIYQYAGSLWAPIIAHTIHNVIASLLLRYRIKPPAKT